MYHHPSTVRAEAWETASQVSRDCPVQSEPPFSNQRYCMNREIRTVLGIWISITLGLVQLWSCCISCSFSNILYAIFREASPISPAGGLAEVIRNIPTRDVDLAWFAVGSLLASRGSVGLWVLMLAKHMARGWFIDHVEKASQEGWQDGGEGSREGEVGGRG